MLLAQSFYKVIFCRQDRRRQHENYQDLTALKASPHHHMAQQAITAVLVVNPDPEWIYKAADRPDDGVCFFILYQTGLHRNYPVSAFFVNA